MSIHFSVHCREASRFLGALRQLLAFVAIGVWFVAPAVAGGTLSLDQALRLARARSQTLVAQDAAVSAARESAVAAGQLPDPTLTVGVNNLPVTGSERFSLTDDFMTMRSIGVMQEFTREGKRVARAARFEREAESAAAGRDLALANMERDTALSWFDRYYQEEIMALLVRQRDETKLQVDAAEAAYRSSRGSQSDVIVARAAVFMVEDRMAQNERQILAAKTMLARWIGKAAGDPLGALPEIDAVSLRPAEIETQMTHHPAIAVLAKQEQVAIADADIARASKQTDWSLALMYSQRGPSYSNMVSINVSIPLQWDQRNRQDREVSAKLAMVEVARAQREELQRVHLAEVRIMLQEWQSNRERHIRFDEALIPLAEQRTQAALVAYRAGAGNLAAVLEARRSEVDIRIERVKLELDTARLWAQLNFLVASDDPTRTARR